ncbi:MAG: peptidylprolyl isomerase [Pseudomonadota bacterium]
MANPLFPDLIVNGERVPHTAVAAEAQNHAAPRGKPGIAWRKAANAIAMRTLLLQEAVQRGVSADSRQLEPSRFETKEDALIRGLLELAVTPEPPTNEQIFAEWARDPERFRTPLLWEVSHILCACDLSDIRSMKAAYERAIALLKVLHLEPGKFALLAERESDCATGKAGGRLGQIGPGDTAPEFEDAIRSLSEGEITDEPVLTQHGYHLIRLDAVAEPKVLPFDAVQPRIRTAMEKAAWAGAARTFVESLVSDAEISGADLAVMPC